ncbi:hypothetical protein Flexsi_1868 [Flexistipes sinusarabici DSM 4947]|uniref:Uncharacterized protein n=1 Tax=Flexistipes sinusarabici (strain ATCC 49648 / DSM 4947 / MAS 10) TaxID=717231 RepID=F8E477_FLESM|nr:hypothetical protein Flexsi_1868 [Flexistipes sinusarabici DSM 4947]
MSYKRLEITKFGGPEVLRIVEERNQGEISVRMQ